MHYRVLADIVFILHLSFVLFVVLGGLLVFKWKRCFWAHIPAVLWGALIEFEGWVCPLTPVENWLRERGGQGGYTAGFVEHYLLPVLYPTVLTRNLQVALGFLILLLNSGIYWWIWRRYGKTQGKVRCT
jgi:hypothetical protein